MRARRCLTPAREASTFLPPPVAGSGAAPCGPRRRDGRPQQRVQSMRLGAVAGLATAAIAAACMTADRGSVAPSAPNFAHDPDLTGMPDLIVDSKMLATSWVVYDQIIKETGCTLEDRKSTRLNSSHSQISYAVFCLK